MRVLAEVALGEIVDEARQVVARLVAQRFGRELVRAFGGRLRSLLLALPLGEVEAAHACDVERLVESRELRVARDEFVNAQERGEVRLLVLEVVARDFEFVLRALLRLDVSHRGRFGPGGHAAALRARRRGPKRDGQRDQANCQ